MEIVYRPYVLKQLKKIPTSERQKIFKKLRSLQTDPHAGKILKGQLEEYRSLRSWPYRIIYLIANETIVICSIAHRQSVYK